MLALSLVGIIPDALALIDGSSVLWTFFA